MPEPRNTMPTWYFEDFGVGQSLGSGELVVESTEAAWFAAAFGSRFVDAGMWSDPPRTGRCLPEWQVTALGMRMICEAFLTRSASLGAPGIETVEWPEPVLVGDRLRLDAHVASLRASRSRPEMGLVGFDFSLFNQHEACVMRQTNVILVRRRARKEDP